MKKISPKMKRIGVLIAVVAVGGAAVTLLVGQVHAGAVKDTEDSSSANTSSATLVVANPEPITPESSSSDTGSAFVPSSGATASKPLTVASKPSVPPKPTPPASSALTDKSKKPSYPSTPKAPAPKSPSQVTSAPKGKTYMPGFGYVDGTGGGQMIQDKKTDHDGDINKQIGNMD